LTHPSVSIFPLPPSSHSFPTRRSSALFLARLSEHGTFGRIPIDSIAALPWTRQDVTNRTPLALNNRLAIISDGWVGRHRSSAIGDRKSTRLNSSHVKISYAVFCLKKQI